MRTLMELGSSSPRLPSPPNLQSLVRMTASSPMAWTFKPQSRGKGATVAGHHPLKSLIIRKIVWRRKGDSNPRIAFAINGFQDRRLKPLGHSSVFILSDFIEFQTLSPNSKRLFPLSRGDCHHFVTTLQLRYCPELRIVITVGITHCHCHRRMAKELLDRHQVHALAREP